MLIFIFISFGQIRYMKQFMILNIFGIIIVFELNSKIIVAT